MSGAIPAANLRVKRIYEPAARADGRRILIDRLWPRGVSKSEAKVDLWLRELAPSTALRTWFDHQPSRWDGFRLRYRRELSVQSEALKALRAMARAGQVTLVYAAHDEAHNNAVALRQVLLRRAPPAPKRRHA